MSTKAMQQDKDSKGVKKGPWSPQEDAMLIEYVRKHGEGNWKEVAQRSGLRRCGKSCRLRWTNQLRPYLRKDRFSPAEEATIILLHSIHGNKWAKISAQLPGRTDNAIKNFMNTRAKRQKRQGMNVATAAALLAGRAADPALCGSPLGSSITINPNSPQFQIRNEQASQSNMRYWLPSPTVSATQLLPSVGSANLSTPLQFKYQLNPMMNTSESVTPPRVFHQNTPDASILSPFSPLDASMSASPSYNFLQSPNYFSGSTSHAAMASSPNGSSSLTDSNNNNNNNVNIINISSPVRNPAKSAIAQNVSHVLLAHSSSKPNMQMSAVGWQVPPSVDHWLLQDIVAPKLQLDADMLARELQQPGGELASVSPRSPAVGSPEMLNCRIRQTSRSHCDSNLQLQQQHELPSVQLTSPASCSNISSVLNLDDHHSASLGFFKNDDVVDVDDRLLDTMMNSLAADILPVPSQESCVNLSARQYNTEKQHQEDSCMNNILNIFRDDVSPSLDDVLNVDVDGLECIIKSNSSGRSWRTMRPSFDHPERS